MKLVGTDYREEIKMGIHITIKDTKFSNQAKAINNLKSNNKGEIDIEMDNVEITDEASVLNNMTDVQVDEVINQLKIQASLFEKTKEDYEKIENLLADIKNTQYSPKKVLQQHLSNLLTGTTANVVGAIIQKVIAP